MCNISFNLQQDSCSVISDKVELQEKTIKLQRLKQPAQVQVNPKSQTKLTVVNSRRICLLVSTYETDKASVTWVVGTRISEALSAIDPFTKNQIIRDHEHWFILTTNN